MKKKIITSTYKHGIYLLLINAISLCASPLFAQGAQDTILANFNIREKIPYEKLYLHLDKPFYGAGEKIWFKGYLLNAITHQDKAESNFIIAELINRSDSILERRKIRRDSLGFHNAFTLPPTLPAGDYYIRGYSNWMLNEEPDYFYSRNLKIGNSIDNTILSNAEYQQEDDTHYTAKVKFFSNTKEPYGNTLVRYRYLENGETKEKGKQKTDENGCISIPLPNLKPVADRAIEVEFDDPQYIYKKRFYIPVFNRDFDVAFFPEGGSLLTLPHQNIAFKAQGADGLSKEIEGVLCNSKGDTLTAFRSEHDGMGIITLSSIKQDSYYAIIKSEDGVAKRFDLPAVEPKGIALSMMLHRKNIRFEIQKTETTEWPQQLFLAAHTREKLLLWLPISPDKSSGKMSDSIFQSGITHFLLVDGQGNTLSERLLFIPDRNPLQWEVSSDKPSYGKREKVALTITAKDHRHHPVKGSFSISITDRKVIQPDSLADNILSNILLTSDLKGHIENPGYYFLNQSPKTQRTLDFVMMTHGWRKHHLTDLRQVPSLDFNNYIEKGQTISGRIKGFFGKGVKKGPICVLAPQANIFATTTTDENGEFLINTAFKDSTSFVIQARTKQGFAGVDIEIDKPSYPDAFHKNPFPDKVSAVMENYLLNTRDHYYMEGGMRVYNLKEVTVTAKRETPKTKSIYTGGINTYTVEGEKLTRYGARTAYDVAIRLPGVSVMNGSELHIRNNPGQAVVIIDNVIYENDNDILNDIPVEDMYSISLLRGTDTIILGPYASAGAIVIMMKDAKDLPAKPARGIVTYNPLGYCDAVEFYHPTYDTPEKKDAKRSDLRSTLYWNPSLQLDAEGKTTIEYYTSDSTAPQDIIIEGVDESGKVSRTVRTILN